MLGLSPEHLLVLLVAALFILGPERLPGAVATVRKTTQKAKDALANAHEQISSEIGPEFEQLRKPLGELNQLRSLDPRTALTRFVLDPPSAEPPTPTPSPSGRVAGVDMEAT
ncbi:Sec-independent protein translocase TatB [Amycolatopsis sp. NPDC004378]